MVLVSVLMSSYNHEKYVAQAIESVLNQTLRDLELIIVDDGSTDKSRQIIEQYAQIDKRIKASFHDKNLGIPTTANDCLRQVSGQYVAYIGSDDLWVETKLEKQLEHLKNNTDKLVWSQAQVIDSKGSPTGQTITQLLGVTKKSGYLFEELLKEQIILFQSLIFSADFAKGLQRDTNLRYVSDHRFIVELSVNRQFTFIEEPLAKYRIHGNNITSRNKTQWMRERITLRQFFVEKYGSCMSNRVKADILHKMGHAYSALGEQSIARKFYLSAFKADHFHKNSILYLLLALAARNNKKGESIAKTYYSLSAVFWPIK
jgi:glycosyltransferase involved in cell wall biosynthesis